MPEIAAKSTNTVVSWTDIYPYLSEEMLDASRSEAAPEDDKELIGLLAVHRVFNPQEGIHLVSTSFFQRLRENGGVLQELPPLLHEWPSDDDIAFELSQLLDGARHIRATKPEVVFRVYLAAELEILVEPLVEAGCEVMLMSTSSRNPSAARMWRFLALEEKRWITFTQAIFGTEMSHDVARSEEIMKTGLGFWRSPGLKGPKSGRLEARAYRPIDPDHFGSKGGLPSSLWMKALVWHCQRETIETRCVESEGLRGYPVEGSKWPSEKFAEWFLLAAVFPRVAFEGIFTFIIWQRKTLSHWYALDIEYVTWANPASEVLVSRKVSTSQEPWTELPESGGIIVRDDTEVFRRERTRIFQGSKYPAPCDGIMAFTPFEGSLRSLLEQISDYTTKSWWVDLNPIVDISPNGAELFLDRRYEPADVVVSDYFFVKITAEIAGWAAGRGLDAQIWKGGWVCKVPKLEGPLTLWKTSFSLRFIKALAGEESYVGPELLLLAWMQEGEATVCDTKVGAMGWKLQQNP